MADTARELRRARKVNDRSSSFPEPRLVALLEQGMMQPPGDIGQLMTLAGWCVELLQLPGGPRGPRGYALIESGLRRLLTTRARVVAGVHLAALVLRQCQVVDTVPRSLCELALCTVRDLAVTDRDITASALERYGAAEGVVRLLARDPEWLPLVLQCYLAGLPLPTVVGQQLLAMVGTSGRHFARIIMECFHVQKQAYQAALVARELLNGPEQRQAVEVLWEAFHSAPVSSHQELLGPVASLLQTLAEKLTADDPLRPMATVLARLAAEAVELRICNYFT